MSLHLTLGDSYWLSGCHLWVVCTLPDKDGNVVMINVTGWKSAVESDENCVVLPVDHPAISKKSVMEYQRARLLSPAEQQHVDANPAICPKKAPVSASLLARIQQGALTSDLTSGKVQAAIRTSIAKQSAQKRATP